LSQHQNRGLGGILLSCLVFLACAGGPETRPPSVDGRSIWEESGRPAPAGLMACLKRAEDLWSQPIPSCDPSNNMGCLGKVLNSWLITQRRELEVLEKELAALGKADPGQTLAAVIILAKSYDLMAHKLRSMPVPQSLVADLEMARIFRLALKRSTAPLRQKAGAYWKQCARLAEKKSEAWHAECSAQAASVDKEMATKLIN